MKFSKISQDCSTKRRNSFRRYARVILSLTILCGLPIALPAQSKKSQHKAPPATTIKPAKFDCGGSVELRVSAAAPAQGTLLIAELRSPDSLSGVAGKWTDRDISFWQSTGATTPKG